MSPKIHHSQPKKAQRLDDMDIILRFQQGKESENGRLAVKLTPKKGVKLVHARLLTPIAERVKVNQDVFVRINFAIPDFGLIESIAGSFKRILDMDTWEDVKKDQLRNQWEKTRLELSYKDQLEMKG